LVHPPARSILSLLINKDSCEHELARLVHVRLQQDDPALSTTQLLSSEMIRKEQGLTQAKKTPTHPA
jgi:hypothetical protein